MNWQRPKTLWKQIQTIGMGRIAAGIHPVNAGTGFGRSLIYTADAALAACYVVRQIGVFLIFGLVPAPLLAGPNLGRFLLLLRIMSPSREDPA